MSKAAITAGGGGGVETNCEKLRENCGGIAGNCGKIATLKATLCNPQGATVLDSMLQYLAPAPPRPAPRFLFKGPDATTSSDSASRGSVSDGDAILLVAKKRTNRVWHTSKWQLSDTRCSMALWHRKEPFSHLNSSVAALTARVTCKHVRRAKQKNCGKIAENCDRLRKIADLNPHPPRITVNHSAIQADKVGRLKEREPLLCN